MKGKIRVSRKSEFEDDNMLHGETYALFHRPAHIATPPLWYQRLLGTATRSVEIWDPYFNYDLNKGDDDCRIFRYFRHSVSIRYLMMESKGNFDERMRICETIISGMIPNGLKCGMNIVFSYISEGDEWGKWWSFHDRFLIIDKERVFLVGSSVGYQLDSKGTSGICELHEEQDKAIVMDYFDDYWKLSISQGHSKEIML